MAKRTDIEYPIAGQNRREDYPQKGGGPYTTPYSRNVRSFDALERRGRGGTRPGLSKFNTTDLGTTITGAHKLSYVDGSGDQQTALVVLVDGAIKIVTSTTVTTVTSYLLTEAGDYITTEAGERIYSTNTISATSPLGDTDRFSMTEHGGKIYIADSECKRYNPNTGTVEVVENAPTGQGLVAVYQERLVLSGEDHMWYMSRQGDFEDWNFGDNYKKIGRAVAGTTGDGGEIGLPITALKAFEDKALLIATADDLWIMQGNINAGGRIDCVSHDLGVIQFNAIDITDGGLVVFLSRQGLYTWQIGGNTPPQPFSERVEPEELRDIATTNDIMIRYDKKENGFYLFITPSTGTGEHWFLDMETKAFWRSIYQEAHQPFAIAKMPIAGDSCVMLCGTDGIVRVHDHDATDDDGTDIVSDIIIGALQPAGYGEEGQILEIIGDMAAGSADVTWYIVPGDTAEEAIDNAVTDLEAGTTTRVHSTGTFEAGHNRPRNPRTRSAWVALWLSSTGIWAYGKISLTVDRVGMLRA